MTPAPIQRGHESLASEPAESSGSVPHPMLPPRRAVDGPPFRVGANYPASWGFAGLPCLRLLAEMLGCEALERGADTMIAVAERPTAIVHFEDLSPPAGTAARALALAYLRYASACWRSDSRAPVFASRLGAYWRPEMPPVPAAAPDAISPHGGGGRGICWRQVDGDILGHVPGGRGGYQIPIGVVPRLVECASKGPLVGDIDGRKSRAGAVA
jgi:hypothetical protein